MTCDQLTRAFTQSVYRCDAVFAPGCGCLGRSGAGHLPEGLFGQYHSQQHCTLQELPSP
jgi:hypothetical protein